MGGYMGGYACACQIPISSVQIPCDFQWLCQCHAAYGIVICTHVVLGFVRSMQSCYPLLCIDYSSLSTT